jgi:hypothetical protein
MLNLYAVKVWHTSEPRHFEMIEVRAYSAQRAEHLASESFPGCMASAKPIFELMESNAPRSPYFRPAARTH